MKHIWLVIYYIWAVLAFIMVPLVTFVCFVFTGRWELVDVYKDWYNWYRSGKAWGGLDRGREV